MTQRSNAATPEPVTDGRIAELEHRLAQLERRLDPEADWERPASSNPDEGDPLDDLFDQFHRDDGSRIQPSLDDCEGVAFVDIMKGGIRPVTWSQLLDALRVVALNHEYQSEQSNNIADAVRAIQEWVSCLSRQLSAPGNPADISEAYVLGIVASRYCWEDPKRADRIRAWWRIIKLWGELANAPLGEGRTRPVAEVYEAEGALAKIGAELV